MQPLQWFYWIFGAILQVLVLSALLRGPYRKYLFLTVYVVVLLLTTVVEAAALLDTGYISLAQRRYYWINDSIRQILLFVIVFGLIHRAMDQDPKRGAVERLLLLGAVTVAGTSFLINSHLKLSKLMTSVGLYLSFFSAILNLVLWSILLRVRFRDRQLLAITGGLGVQFTAEAIGQALRHLSPTTVYAGNIIMATGHLFCMYFWWMALRVRERKPGFATPEVSRPDRP